MSDMIERVAIALAGVWMEMPPLPADEVMKRWRAWTPAMREPWMRSARIAIEAMREPTFSPEAVSYHEGMFRGDFWRAMIDRILEENPTPTPAATDATRE